MHDRPATMAGEISSFRLVLSTQNGTIEKKALNPVFLTQLSRTEGRGICAPGKSKYAPRVTRRSKITYCALLPFFGGFPASPYRPTAAKAVASTYRTSRPRSILPLPNLLRNGLEKARPHRSRWITEESFHPIQPFLSYLASNSWSFATRTSRSPTSWSWLSQDLWQRRRTEVQRTTDSL
jgi:hypothetical protein